MALYVDTRHSGHFGMARYATEVLPRLDLPARPLVLKRDPMSALSLIERGWRTPEPGDLIYSPAFWPGRSRARQVLTVHDLIHLHGSGAPGAVRRRYFERVVKPAVLRAGHVLTVSDASADALREWLGDDVRVHVSGDACSDAFVPDGPVHAHPRPYVLFVGNAKAHKNVDLLIGSLRHLPGYDLICVSADRSELAQVAAEYGALGRVWFVSGLEDVELAAYYRGAAVLAQPSTVEGFGLPPLEAICSGTPVAYLRMCRAVAEVVGSDGVGSASATDEEAYADALVRAVELKGSVVRSRPSWGDVAARVRAALLEIDPGLGQR